MHKRKQTYYFSRVFIQEIAYACPVPPRLFPLKNIFGRSFYISSKENFLVVFKLFYKHVSFIYIIGPYDALNDPGHGRSAHGIV